MFENCDVKYLKIIRFIWYWIIRNHLSVNLSYPGEENIACRGNTVSFVSLTRSHVYIYFIHLFSFTKETNRPVGRHVASAWPPLNLQLNLCNILLRHLRIKLEWRIPCGIPAPLVRSHCSTMAFDTRISHVNLWHNSPFLIICIVSVSRVKRPTSSYGRVWFSWFSILRYRANLSENTCAEF